MFTFASPYAFLLLLPLAAATWFVYRRRARAGILFSPVSRIRIPRSTWRTLVVNAVPATFIVSLLLCVLALARPRTTLSVSRRTVDAIAIEMVVDVSGSMEALDFSTKTQHRSRLDTVKETFADFIEQRPDDLVGLVTFGGYAATRAPLTSDHDALLHVLGGVEIPSQTLDKNGQVMNKEELLTAIGDALATACARLENAEPVSRIIVLLTDGESNTGVVEPETAMTAAKEMGIKVYTIGIGSTGRAPFRARDVFGRQTIQYAMVSLDEQLLKRIANETGGQYFNVRNPKGLAGALENIDELERTEIEQDVFREYNELFPWFLAPGAGLLLVAAAMGIMVTRKIV